jgi:hypothetical protein
VYDQVLNHRHHPQVSLLLILVNPPDNRLLDQQCNHPQNHLVNQVDNPLVSPLLIPQCLRRSQQVNLVDSRRLVHRHNHQHRLLDNPVTGHHLSHQHRLLGNRVQYRLRSHRLLQVVSQALLPRIPS